MAKYRLVSYLKSKTLKYKSNAKDSMKRLQVVKKKLQEYDGLNRSVFETIDQHERIMNLRDNSEVGERNSFISENFDMSPIAIGGQPNFNGPPSFCNEDEIFAATGSSSQHRRAKSRPYMYKQKSDAMKMQIAKLENDLVKLDRRRPSYSKIKSNPAGYGIKNNLGKEISFKIPNPTPSDISDIRFPSERR